MKNSMKTPDQKKRSKQLGKEIRDSRKRYEDLRVHGGSDPFWSDGANMNLCRNHVMYFRKQVETELDPENYPEEYFLEIPAEVSVHYMADPDGIRSRSTAALEVLKENQDFQYLRNQSVHEPSTLCPGNGRCDPEGRSGGNAKMPGSGILRQIFERKSEKAG